MGGCQIQIQPPTITAAVEVEEGGNIFATSSPWPALLSLLLCRTTLSRLHAASPPRPYLVTSPPCRVASRGRGVIVDASGPGLSARDPGHRHPPGLDLRRWPS
ncbi:hypothetical protein E2562_024029 [Oryza meyeriana var. granulata]|uniref:Uncharacterized protein n=1 Tax=Oryza meyeriana var. granulata TaxID=110450 RepID=A0A6G1CSH0_9ORYZ|nr:hypothetical protein E2562_024029 [Oryza meyeriana var. granulata]